MWLCAHTAYNNIGILSVYATLALKNFSHLKHSIDFSQCALFSILLDTRLFHSLLQNQPERIGVKSIVSYKNV